MKDHKVIRNEEEIKDFIQEHEGEELDYDNTVDMPEIGNLFNRFDYFGVDEEVNCLQEFEEYKNYYNIIYDILNHCFKKNLHEIFKNAVNSLIFYAKSEDEFYSDETMFEVNKPISSADMFSKKINYSAGDDGLRVFKAESNIKQLLNMINVAKGKKKVYSPYSIKRILDENNDRNPKTEQEIKNGEYMLFPVFTEKGMVTEVKDGNLELMFDLITKDEGKILKGYMIRERGSDINISKDDINRLFDEYESLAEDFNSNSDTEKFLDTLKRVVKKSIKLFDIDISGFKKGGVHVNILTPEDQFAPIDIIYEDDENVIEKDQDNHKKDSNDDGPEMK